MINEYFKELQIEDTIIQIGEANNVMHCIKHDDNFDMQSFIDKNEDKDLYFVGGLSPSSGLSRGSDTDVLKKNYFVLDFDIREIEKNRIADPLIKEAISKENPQNRKEESDLIKKIKDTLPDIDDAQLSKVINKILTALNSDKTLGSYYMAVNSGNGLHIHYLDTDIIDIDNIKHFKEGFKVLLRYTSDKIYPVDEACFNTSRLFRIPQSFNNKSTKKPVVVLQAPRERCTLLKRMIDRGIEEVKRIDEQKQEFEKRKIQKIDLNGDSDIFEAINQIDVVNLICSLYPVYYKEGNNNFYHKYGEKANMTTGYFKDKESNYVVWAGSTEIPGDVQGDPAAVIKSHFKHISYKDTIDWFCNEYPSIADIRDKEKKDWVENKQKEESEIIADSIANEEIPDFKQYFKTTKDKDDKTIKAQTKKGIYEIAKHITSKWHCLSLGDFKRDIFIYEDAVYKLGTNILKTYVQDLLEEIYSIGFFNEILEQIKNRTTKEREEIEDTNRNLVNLNDGILDLKTKKIKAHNPKKYYFFNKVPVSFDPMATCENILQVFNDLLEPDQVDIIQEMFGFVLYRQYFVKKAFIMSGIKNTGKTTIIKILMALVGAENISGVSLQELGVRHFAIADLHNKYANIYDDMSSEDITNTGKFKMVTGQSPLSGEYKFGARFYFVNYAKLIFACNKIPAVNDVDDEAYFDRWILLNFNKVISESKKDPFLIEKITENPGEMSGLLNFAIAGLQRLLANGKFSYNKTPEQIKQEMLQNSNPIASFVYNCLVKTDQDNFSAIKKEEMYRAYGDYCEKRNLGIETDDKFYKDILTYAPYLRDYRPGTAPGMPRPLFFKNVKLLTENI